MVIQVDTREHKSEWGRIQSQFDSLGVQYFRSKLYCGDYQSLDNAKLCIDRKKDLQELCGNVCQQHERFKAELIRAREAGIQLIILSCRMMGSSRVCTTKKMKVETRHCLSHSMP